MKYAIYSRKSVYTGKGESIENQIEMCKQYIFSKFSGAVKEDIAVYEDEGFSAKNTDRPQFQKMLADIKRKGCEYVVCYRLDRISRSVSDFSALIEDLNNRSISFICIKEEFDTSKPMGKAMMYIASVFAQLERETIAERVRDNMLMLARTGRWLGGPPPTGYVSEKVQEIIMDGKLKDSCQLKENPDEIKAIDIIFEKFLELRSLHGVSKHLIQQGIRTRSGKIYSSIVIKDILQNPVYSVADKHTLDYFTERNADVCFTEKDCGKKCGIIAYNKRDYKKKQAPRLSVEKWIIAVGKHKGRIAGQKWVAAQNYLKDNISDGKRPAKAQNDYSLLSGMIFCAECGNRMFAKTRNGRKDLYDYICHNKLRGGTHLCRSKNLSGVEADDTVCEYLMQYADVNSDIFKKLAELKSEAVGKADENPLTTIESLIKKYNDEMDNLVNSVSHGNIGQAFVQRVNLRISEIDKELTALNSEYEKLKNNINSANSNERELELIVDMLADFKTNYKNLTLHERRAFIKILTQKLSWDGRDLHIFINGG